MSVNNDPSMRMDPGDIGEGNRQTLLGEFAQFCLDRERPIDLEEPRPVVTTQQSLIASAAHDFVYARAVMDAPRVSDVSVLPRDSVERQLKKYYSIYPHAQASEAEKKQLVDRRSSYGVIAIRQGSARYDEIYWAGQLFQEAREAQKHLVTYSMSDLLAAYGMALHDLHLVSGRVALHQPEHD